jgi:hypothetical protein
VKSAENTNERHKSTRTTYNLRVCIEHGGAQTAVTVQGIGVLATAAAARVQQRVNAADDVFEQVHL